MALEKGINKVHKPVALECKSRSAPSRDNDIPSSVPADIRYRINRVMNRIAISGDHDPKVRYAAVAILLKELKHEFK